MGQQQTQQKNNDRIIPKSLYCFMKMINLVEDLIIKQPQIYYNSGQIYTDNINYFDIPEQIDGRGIAFWVFIKNKHSLSGTSGLLNFCLQKNGQNYDKFMQIMWSVSNNDQQVNWGGIRFTSEKAEKKIFKKVYNEKMEDLIKIPALSETPSKIIYLNFDLEIEISLRLTEKQECLYELEINKIKMNISQLLHEKMQEQLKIQEELIKFIDELIIKIKEQELKVNSVNTLNSSVTVAGAGMLFNPVTAPVGGMMLISSGVVGIGTIIVDFLSNQIKNHKLSLHIQREQAIAHYIQQLHSQLILISNQIHLQSHFSQEESLTAAFIGIYTLIQNTYNPESLFQNQSQLIQQLIQICNHSRYFNLSFIESFKQVVQISLAPQKIQINAGFSAKFVQNGSNFLSGLSVAGRTFTVFGAIFSVADVIYSWLNKSPSRKQAEQLKNQLLQNIHNNHFIIQQNQQLFDQLDNLQVTYFLLLTKQFQN